MHTLKHFVIWIKVPIESVRHGDILAYIDHLYERRLNPKTINSYLDSIRGFYNYLIYEEQLRIDHPVKPGYAARVPEPLPRYLKDEDVNRFFKVIQKIRDRAMFMIMLRCGLRVEEVANLTIRALDLPRSQLLVVNGKGSKDRVAYISNDASEALQSYLKIRSGSRARKVFLVEKGNSRGKPISVRGIQKRMEYYAKKSGVKVSCHQLRHTMATQLLNADADLVTIQDLLGHTRIRTTQRYCRVSNLKVQRDYHKAMAVLMDQGL
jgi:site-specific recombinase XerD